MSQRKDIDLERTREWKPGDVEGGNIVRDDTITYKGYLFQLFTLRVPESDKLNGLIYASRTLINPAEKSFGGRSVHLRHVETCYATWSDLPTLKRAITDGNVYAE